MNLYIYIREIHKQPPSTSPLRAHKSPMIGPPPPVKSKIIHVAEARYIIIWTGKAGFSTIYLGNGSYFPNVLFYPSLPS